MVEPCRACAVPEASPAPPLPRGKTRDAAIRDCSPACGVGRGESTHCVGVDETYTGTDRACEDCPPGASWSAGARGDACSPCAVCAVGQGRSQRCYPHQNAECFDCPGPREERTLLYSRAYNSSYKSPFK